MSDCLPAIGMTYTPDPSTKVEVDLTPRTMVLSSDGEDTGHEVAMVTPRDPRLARTVTRIDASRANYPPVVEYVAADGVGKAALPEWTRWVVQTIARPYPAVR